MRIRAFVSKYGTLTMSAAVLFMPALGYIAGLQYHIDRLQMNVKEDHVLFLKDLDNKSLVTKIKIDDLSTDLNRVNQSLELMNKRLDNVNNRLDKILLRVNNDGS